MRLRPCPRWLALLASMALLGRAEEPKDLYGDPLPPHAIARIGTLRFRHPDGATSVAWLPDGKTLVSAGGMGEIRFWDPETGRLRRVIQSKGTRVTAVAVSPDGTLLAWASQLAPYAAYGVQLWDVKAEKELRLIRHPMVELKMLAFSPDGKTLAIGEAANGLFLWDVEHERKRATIRADGQILALAFSPDGRTIAAGGYPSVGLTLWDASSGKQAWRVEKPAMGVSSIAFSPKNDLMAVTGSEPPLVIRDSRNGAVVEELATDGDSAHGVAFSPDGRYLAVVESSHAVTLWEVDGWKRLLCSEKARAYSGALAFSPDGKTLAFGAGGTVRLWPLSKDEVPPEEPGGGGSMDLSPDGRTIAICGGGLGLSDAGTGRPIWRRDEADAYTVAFTPDGKRMVTAEADGGVRLRDASDGEELRTLLKGEKPPEFVAVSPDGRWLAAGGREALTTVCPLAGEGRPIVLGSRSYGGDGASFSSDGTLLATGSDHGKVALWTLPSGGEVALLADLHAGAYRVCLSSDGKWLALNAGAQPSVIEIASRKEVGFAPWMHPDCTGPMDFTVDGRIVATGGRDRVVRIWDLRAGRALTSIEGHQAPVWHLRFSRDGSRLATGSDDGTTLVWDTSTWVAQLGSHADETTPEDLEEAWSALAGDDPKKAYGATWALAEARERGVDLLRAKLLPLAEGAEAGEDPVPPGEALRQLRAIQALELVGTEGALGVLREIAAGPQGTRRTREAEAAVARVKTRRR